MSILGDALKKQRERLRKSIADMATALGVSTTTIVNYETGRRSPDLDFLIKFTEVTGSDFIYWLELRVDESNAPGAAAAKSVLDGIADALEAHLPTKPIPANIDLLKEVISGVETYLEEVKKGMPADKKAGLIVVLYEQFEAKGHVEIHAMERLLRLVA